MSAHRLNKDWREMLATGFAAVKDPGASGTITYDHKGFGICSVVTAGAESRALPVVTAHPVGTLLAVLLKTDGGNLTVTGSDQTIVLTNAGEAVLFVLSDNDGTKAWRVAGDSRLSYATLAAGTSTGTGDISTYNETVFKQVLTILAAAGILTDDTTT